MTYGTGREDYEQVLAIGFGGFLTEALAAGKYKVAPPPQVVSRNGLDLQ